MATQALPEDPKSCLAGHLSVGLVGHTGAVDSKSSPPPLDDTDLVLVLLAADTSDPKQRFRCNGITRLEKLLFLLSHDEAFKPFAKEVAAPFTFEAYHYGPYSKAVYDAVDLLKALRLLREKRVDVSTGLDLSEEFEALDLDDLEEIDGTVERQFILTEDGKAVAKLLSTRISPDGKAILSRLKDRFGRMPLRQLLRYVYARYPDFTVKSRIRSEVG
jgi:hypothetical protein